MGEDMWQRAAGQIRTWARRSQSYGMWSPAQRTLLNRHLIVYCLLPSELGVLHILCCVSISVYSGAASCYGSDLCTLPPAPCALRLCGDSSVHPVDSLLLQLQQLCIANEGESNNVQLYCIIPHIVIMLLHCNIYEWGSFISLCQFIFEYYYQFYRTAFFMLQYLFVMKLWMYKISFL